MMIAFNMKLKDMLGGGELHYIFMLFLLIDIFVNLNTAIFEKGIITFNRSKIYHNYKKNGLL